MSMLQIKCRLNTIINYYYDMFTIFGERVDLTINIKYIPCSSRYGY